MHLQFPVGRTRAVNMVPLRPAAAKTIHRSQSATETRVVVNFETKKTIPHIHYVGLSRVTTLKGLYRTDIPHKKIAVSSDVKPDMQRWHTKAALDLCITPLYKISPSLFKLCVLNTRSLHKDYSFKTADSLICAETRCNAIYNDNMYICLLYTSPSPRDA